MIKQLPNKIYDFFKGHGINADEIIIEKLQGDGSNRNFWRMNSHESRGYILMINPPENIFARKENQAYLLIGSHLKKKGIPVPTIYQYDLDEGWFIMEDMGVKSLKDVILNHKNPHFFYEKVLDVLFRLQTEGVKEFNPAWCCQTKSYNLKVMRENETDYFKKAFLIQYLGLKREWPELEEAFNHLANMAAKEDSNFLLHRDFQSKNIMIRHGEVGIIDWQGARLGPLGYDLASLLIDPYPELSLLQKNEIYNSYLGLIEEYDSKRLDSFKIILPYFLILRNLQILGAFSYLTKIAKKGYFEAYIPKALKSLKYVLNIINDHVLDDLKNLVTNLLDSSNR